MTRNLVAAVAGAGLVFALAGVISPAMAWGSVHPAGPAYTKLMNPAAPPTVRDIALPGHKNSEGDAPTLENASIRPGGAVPVKAVDPSTPE